MEKVRIKAGHMEINYGDAHFRRSDGGHTLQNPFVENNIVDAFATEVAGEFYNMDRGFTGMIGLSNGLINGGHQKPLVTPTGTETYSRNPSIYAKLAYDNAIASDVRLRVSGSVYHNNSDGRSTLYAGDRTGSNYFFAMEPAGAAAATNFTTGRFNPSFTNQITTGQLNAFLKASGFELFGTFETGKGRTIAEKAADQDKRGFNQIAADALYRFGANENAYIGVKYNTVKGALLSGSQDKQSIDRIAAAAGWFITKNILLKGEYVNQNYKDFPGTHANFGHLDGGKFHGVVFSASVGF